MFRPKGHVLAAGSADSRIATVMLWDTSRPADPAPLGEPLHGHSDAVTALAFSGDGNLLAAGGYDDSIYLWDIADPRHVKAVDQPLTAYTSTVASVAFSPDGRVLAGGSADKSIALWELSQVRG